MIEYAHPPKKDVIYMVSEDIRIVINGQAFRVEGDVLRAENQNNFQQEVLRRLDGIESRLGMIEAEQRLLHVRVDDLQTSVYWVLGVVTLIFTMVTLPAAITAIISLFRKPEPSHPDAQSITNSLAEAFLKGLTLGKNERD